MIVRKFELKKAYKRSEAKRRFIRSIKIKEKQKEKQIFLVFALGLDVKTEEGPNCSLSLQHTEVSRR